VLSADFRNRHCAEFNRLYGAIVVVVVWWYIMAAPTAEEKKYKVLIAVDLSAWAEAAFACKHAI